MKRFVVLLGLLAAVAGVMLVVTQPRVLLPGTLPTHQPDAVNGEYLFHAGGCVSCHESAGGDTGPPLLGGGLAMETPFGVFHVPNISPDPVHGIGAWTTLDFINAMKQGVAPDGRHYYPAFPYGSYTRMQFVDLVDLKAYLDTLPGVAKENKPQALKFPWNIRRGIGLWKLVNLSEQAVIMNLPNDALTSRGQYLVEGPAHCGACHTPRDWTGGLDLEYWLGGAADPEGEGRVPNITPGGKGMQGWSKNDIAYYLESGFTPDFDTVGGSMAKVQKNMARLTADDREAIAAYLLAIPAKD